MPSRYGLLIFRGLPPFFPLRFEARICLGVMGLPAPLPPSLPRIEAACDAVICAFSIALIQSGYRAMLALRRLTPRNCKETHTGLAFSSVGKSYTFVKIIDFTSENTPK